MTAGGNPFLENKENKKPVDVVSDENVRHLIQKYMENRSELNGSNFFKSMVMKKHKADFISILTKK